MKYIHLAMLLLFCLLQVSTTVKDAKPSIGLKPGSLSPELLIVDREGVECSLSDYSGQRVLLNFWAAYDSPSRERNIRFSRTLNQSVSSDVAYLSVSLDYSLSVYKGTVDLDGLQPRQQFVYKQGERDVLMKQFKLSKGLQNLLIDENGVIVARNISPEELAQSLKRD